MNEPAIRAIGLTKRFGSVQALRALDLEVEHGEVFGYLGPNGAGKTTTIRLLLDFYGRLRGGVDPTWVGDLLRRFDLDPGRLSGSSARGTGARSASSRRSCTARSC